MSKPPADKWSAAREAVALGVPPRRVAETYGMTFAALRQRMSREKWPRPEQLTGQPPPPVAQPSQLAAQSWAEKGEMHRAAVFKLVSEALAKAKPRKLEEWADIERAARIADRAAGLDKPAPAVNICFPEGLSSESRPIFDISANDAINEGGALDL